MSLFLNCCIGLFQEIKKCMGLLSYYLIYINVYLNTIPTLKWNVTSYSNIYSKTIFTRKCNVNFVFLIMN